MRKILNLPNASKNNKNRLIISLEIDILESNFQNNCSNEEIDSNFILKLLNRKNLALRNYDLTDAMWHMLLFLFIQAKNGAKTQQKELSIVTGISQSTVIRNINSLLTREFIFRNLDKIDKRRVWIDISEHGISTIDDWMFLEAPILIQNGQSINGINP